MLRDTAIFLALVLYCSCSLSSNEQKIGKDTRPSTPKKLNLFAVDSVYKPYFPDTKLKFNDYKELLKYRTQIIRSFDSLSKKRLDTTANNDSVKLANISASRHIADLLEVQVFKFIKTAKRDEVAMSMLGIFFKYSEIVPIEQRLELFHTFPKELQNSSIGKNALKQIREGLFDKNIGFNIGAFDQLKIKDTAGQYILLKDAFNSNHEYYLLMFGASWCSPCRSEEFQMKHWLSAIDTSKVKLVALSLDTKEKKWINYIREDKTPWNSYLLKDEWDNTFVKRLGVNSIPRNFLVNNKKEITMEHPDIRKILKKTPHVNVQ